MRAAGEASGKLEAARLRRKCQDMITYAEKLKTNLTGTAKSAARPAASLNTVPSTSISSSPSPTVILKLGSRLHGNEFPAWKEHPAIGEFELVPGQAPFTCVESAFYNWRAAPEYT